MHSKIRKMGNSSAVIIPLEAMAISGFKQGDLVDIDCKNGQIVMHPKVASYTLEELLDASPSKAVKLSAEDKEWLGKSTVGQELL